MAYFKILQDINADQLWCGKGSAYECLIALLHSIEKNHYMDFPQYDKLLSLEQFMIRDKSDKFYSRTKELEAPPNTGRVPLGSANASLLIKLLVNRIDYVCINYFKTPKSSDWEPRNTYGEQILEFWNTFNTKYIPTVMEFIKNYKVNSESKEIEGYKKIVGTLKGAWSTKVEHKISQLEESLKISEAEVKEMEKNTNDIPKKEHDKTEKKSKYNKKNDDEPGEWVKVGKKPHTMKNKKNVKK